ncbi:MAG: hypothetical protein CVU84_12650 [Firmicutes bacterium HGW-Firmicutes-1]|nr:MAG: hypothetical protein CVU84_12650 [Firmicutes bacterium HGW-Firmicutes-1]
MKRIFTILLILTILVTSSASAFAIEKGEFDKNENKVQNHKGKDKSQKLKNVDKAQTLYDLGLFKGTSRTSYIPDLDRMSTRAEAIVLIGTSLGWPTTNITSVPGYPDVPAWAAPYVAYALENNITKGTGHNKFGADLPVNERMIYTWYYRALLFTGDSWKNSEFLVTAGLITQEQADQMKDELTGLTDTAVIRDKIVGIMFDSMQWKEKGSNQRLIQKLVKNSRVDWKKAKDRGLMPDSNELTFDVKATSLKAVSVEFSQLLNISTVTSALFDIKVGEVSKVFGTDFTLETIDKTVYIVFNNLLTQASTVSVGVKEGIKSVDGVAVTVATKSVIVNDIVSPLVTAVEVTNPTTIKINFSESMNILTGNLTHDNILIDGSKAIGTSTMNASKTILTLVLDTAILGGNHNIQVNSGLADFSGLKTIEYNKAFSLPLDITSPSVISVTADERDKIVIKFNEEINKNEGFIFVGQVQYPLTAAIINGDTAYLPLSIPLTTESTILGTLLTIKGIKDLSNNAVDSTVGKNFIFKATNDITPPTATVKVLVDKTIEVQFSEVIDAFTLADYTLTANGVIVPSTISYNSADKKAIIVITTAPVESTTYTLSILDTVLDNSVSQNRFVPISFQLVINN